MENTLNVKPRMTRSWWMLVIFILALSGLWCFLEIQVAMSTTGGMFGFHPLIFFAFPAAALLSLAILAIALFKKSQWVGYLCVFPVLALPLPIFFAYELNISGWSQEIRRYSDQNEAAIMKVDFATAVFHEVPYKDHEEMVAVPGFTFSKPDDMLAIEDGVYYGFSIDGNPHVYVKPLFNGARGVAWLTDTAIIGKDPGVQYEYSGVGNWYIWTLH